MTMCHLLDFYVLMEGNFKNVTSKSFILLLIVMTVRLNAISQTLKVDDTRLVDDTLSK